MGLAISAAASSVRATGRSGSIAAACSTASVSDAPTRSASSSASARSTNSRSESARAAHGNASAGSPASPTPDLAARDAAEAESICVSGRLLLLARSEMEAAAGSSAARRAG